MSGKQALRPKAAAKTAAKDEKKPPKVTALTSLPQPQTRTQIGGFILFIFYFLLFGRKRK